MTFVAISFNGIFTFATPIYAFIIIPLLEVVLKDYNRVYTETEKEKRLMNRIFDRLLYLNIPFVFFLLAYIIVPGLLFILSYSNFNIIQQHYPATKDLFIILPIACYFYFFFLSKKVLQAIKID